MDTEPAQTSSTLSWPAICSRQWGLTFSIGASWTGAGVTPAASAIGVATGLGAGASAAGWAVDAGASVTGIRATIAAAVADIRRRLRVFFIVGSSRPAAVMRIGSSRHACPGRRSKSGVRVNHMADYPSRRRGESRGTWEFSPIEASCGVRRGAAGEVNWSYAS